MIGLSALLLYAFYELFSANNLIQASRGLFRLSAVTCLILMIYSERVEVYVGAALIFGMTSLICLWAFRSEVLNNDPQP